MIARWRPFGDARFKGAFVLSFFPLKFPRLLAGGTRVRCGLGLAGHLTVYEYSSTVCMYVDMWRRSTLKE